MARSPDKAARDSVVRFGVAMPGDLLERFDLYVKRRGYTNRSEALRDLVRAELATEAWDRGEHVVAAITVVYDHHVPGLTEKLVSIQHDSGGHVISTMHVHLDHSQCLEIIVAKGPAQELEKMADELVRTRGVLIGRIVPAVATELPAHDGEEHPHPHRH
jgi:CopG family transcriptional regulator, nickel-responsive regulator